MKHQTPTDEQLEHWLRALPLRHPSDALDRRLRGHSSLAGPVLQTVVRWALAACIGAAVSFPIGLWYGSTAQSANPAQPVASPSTPANNPDQSQLVEQAVEVVWDAPQVVAVQTDAAGQPVYALRQTGIESRTWSDPTQSTTLQTRTPQQRVVWVEGQTY